MSRRCPAATGWAVLLFATLALVWAGMIVGVSGIATPAKFSTPTLTRPVALDVVARSKALTWLPLASPGPATPSADTSLEQTHRRPAFWSTSVPNVERLSNAP